MSKKPAHKHRNRKSRAKRPRRRWVPVLVIAIVVAAAACCVALRQSGRLTAATNTSEDIDASEVPDYIDVQLLTVNSYSRPGIALDEVNGIVIHYTANPGTTAQENRDYFEGLATSGEAKVSSHFVIGIDGEVIQCIPTAEIAYASNSRNSDTLSIECCHKSEDGSFTKKTYNSLMKLTAWLCLRYGLTSDDVIRHYDVTGKNCPKYFVEHEDAWETFKADVDALIVKNS